MRVIHKFGPFVPREIITLENVHRILFFAEQNKRMYVWCEVDKEQLRQRYIRALIVGTGWDYEHYWNYRNSLIHSNGNVWHLLEEREAMPDANTIF